MPATVPGVSTYASACQGRQAATRASRGAAAVEAHGNRQLGATPAARRPVSPIASKYGSAGVAVFLPCYRASGVSPTVERTAACSWRLAVRPEANGEDTILRPARRRSDATLLKYPGQ